MIGFVEVNRFISDTAVAYHVKSEIKTRILVNLAIRSDEKSVFKGDTLIYSKVYRKINKKVKVEREMEYINGDYHLKCKKNKSRFGPAITQINLATMFFDEPVNHRVVFSDAHNQLLKLIDKGNGAYQVIMPNGDKHTFFYEDGMCTKIEASGLFYKIKLKCNNHKIKYHEISKS